MGEGTGARTSIFYTGEAFLAMEHTYEETENEFG